MIVQQEKESEHEAKALESLGNYYDSAFEERVKGETDDFKRRAATSVWPWSSAPSSTPGSPTGRRE